MGVEVFTPIATHYGQRWTFIASAIVAVLGGLVTYFFIPNVSGDDLAVADERFRLYLIEHGWEGSVGAEGSKTIPDQRPSDRKAALRDDKS